MNQIHTEAQYDEALARLSVLVDEDPEAGSRDGRELIALSEAVEAYEAEHYPMEGLRLVA